MKASTGLHLALGALLASLSVSALAQNAVTTGSVNALAGPDNSYPVVAQLDADTPVQVMGCLNDWSWCDVGFEGNRGWVYAPSITYEYQGGYVPLYSYAPGLGIPVVAFSIDTYWGSHYHDRPWYSQREEWIRRGPPHHERPPGPLPSSAPPPREARMDRPRPDSHSDRSVHLSSAQPSRGEADRHGGTAEHGDAKRARPDAHPPGAEAHVTPAAPRAETHPGPAERAAPQHDEERAHPAPHASPSRHEERPSAPPNKEERPNKDEKSDHPG